MQQHNHWSMLKLIKAGNMISQFRKRNKLKSYMGKARKSDWSEMYAIYGIEEWQTPALLLLEAGALALLSFLYLSHISSSSATRLVVASLTALSALYLLFAACNLFYSSGPLRWEMSHRMLASVPDWSSVNTALDVGCGGRGMLLNAVAKQLKQSGSSGRVVGLDLHKSLGLITIPWIAPSIVSWLNLDLHKSSLTLSTLRAAGIEGVKEYVTCREGDVRRLPFGDDYFDVVVSAMCVHRVAEAERVRVVGEVARVLKPGGVGVMWDLVHVPEYVTKLREMRMEDISVSDSVTAFMMSSHIVTFTKPRHLHVISTSGHLTFSIS